MDYKDENMWLLLGDCLERMQDIPDGSVDAITKVLFSVDGVNQ